MQELEKLNEQLKKNGKGEKLKTIAESSDGLAVSRMIDAAAVERAAKSGDTAALRDILSGVLSTEEGRRLAENIRKAMK